MKKLQILRQWLRDKKEHQEEKCKNSTQSHFLQQNANVTKCPVEKKHIQNCRKLAKTKLVHIS